MRVDGIEKNLKINSQNFPQLIKITNPQADKAK